MCVISIVCLTSRPAPRNRRRRRARSHPEQVPGAACSSSRLPSLAARRDALANRAIAVVDRAAEIVGGVVGQLRRSICRGIQDHRRMAQVRRRALPEKPRAVLPWRLTLAVGSLEPDHALAQDDLCDEVRAVAEPARAGLRGIKITRKKQREQSGIFEALESNLDEGGRELAAFAKRRVGADQIETQLRTLRRQEIERLVLPVAAIDDVAGVDPRTALAP